MHMEQTIMELFYKPELGLSSATKLYQKLKNDGITLKQIKDFLTKQESFQISKRVTKPKSYIPIIAYAPNDMLQVDILDFSNMSSTNSNFKYYLVAIDIFTRAAFIVPVKTKTTTDVIDAMSKIINKFHPNEIETYPGSEFISRKMNELLTKHNV